MPLVTQIRRQAQDGSGLETLKLKWGWWHVRCMALQSVTDTTVDPKVFAEREVAVPFGSPIAERGKHVVQFATGYRDPADGEVLILLPGDELGMWRE